MAKAVTKSIFAMLAVLFGSTIIIGVLYNEFVERRPAYVRARGVPLFGAGPAMFSCGILWGRQALNYFRSDA